MKSYKPFLMGVVLALLIVAVFWAGNVYAATCFSDISTLPTIFQDAICWMKTKGVTSGYPDGTYNPNGTVTRAQMALFMRNQAEVPPTTGDIQINTGPMTWQINANYTSSARMQHYYGWTHFEGTTTGTKLFSMSPSLPSSLYNTKMYVKGAKICYDASYAGAYITTVELKHMYYNASGFSEWNSISDPTDLMNTGCRTIMFTSPSSFWGTDQVTINVYVQIDNTSSTVYMGPATIILTPSTEPAVLDIEQDRVGGTSVTDDPDSGQPTP